MHTKAMLLVYDDQTEAMKVDTLLKQRVRANNQLRAAIGN
jgi:hypothetical protein